MLLTQYYQGVINLKQAESMNPMQFFKKGAKVSSFFFFKNSNTHVTYREKWRRDAITYQFDCNYLHFSFLFFK
jgi:hypothetical protein